MFSSSRRDSCQVLVALTHIGSKYDRELADEASEYDLITVSYTHLDVYKRQVDVVVFLEVGQVENHLVTHAARFTRIVGAVLRLEGRRHVAVSYTHLQPEPAAVIAWR